MAKDGSEIGYVLKGYPRTSETFITNEIFLLESLGLKLSIFSLIKLEGQKRHSIIDKITATVTYLPQMTPSDEDNFVGWLWKNVPNFAASHWKLFRLRTMAYMRALIEAFVFYLKYRNGAPAAPQRSFIKEFLQAGLIAAKVLESGRIRHLHAHFCHTSTTVTMLASMLCDVPFSFTAHAKDIYRKDMNPGDLLRVKMRRAKFVVTCTRANEEYLKSIRSRETPLYTIYHGLDMEIFSPSDDRWKKDSNPPLILSAGRMVEKKGFIHLVEACRLLKDKGYEFECRIVGGSGPYEETIRSSIERLKLEETVILQYAVTQEELRLIYERSTLFALPCQVIDDGDRDGIPNVLVEAMAMEVPVVSTDISGIPELIENRANGLLVPQRDARALATAIEELLSDANLRLRLGKAARTTVGQKFDSRKNIMQLKSLLDGTDDHL